MSQSVGGSNSKLSDFEMGRTLGEGSYSSVVEATYRPSGKVYALKILDKRHIIKEKKVKYVHVEKEALNLLADCPSVIRLHWTFQDQQSLYFVLELVERGEILTYIKQFGSLSVECIRFYGAELLQAIDWLHQRNCLHRDLKPENLLLDSGWHIKLADFGSAKIFKETVLSADEAATTMTEERANSFVGTAEYVSPELLNEKAASKESDLWAYGCILFQMACGRPPFKAGNDYQIFQKILRLDYSFPEPFEQEQLKDLISKLLVLEPQQRLTSAQIKEHSFFTGIDWTAPLHTQTPPALQAGQFKRSNSAECAAVINTENSSDDSHDSNNGGGSLNNSVEPTVHSLASSGRISDIALQDEGQWKRYLQPDETIVHTGVLNKWRKLFPKQRFFILTDRPRLIYIEPRTGVVKGQVPLQQATSDGRIGSGISQSIRVQVKDAKNFLIHTPSRTYVLEDPDGDAQGWSEAIAARLPL